MFADSIILWIIFFNFNFGTTLNDTKDKQNNFATIKRINISQAVVMVEGHMDDGLTMSRAQEEENKSARVIRKCTSLISRFVK